MNLENGKSDAPASTPRIQSINGQQTENQLIIRSMNDWRLPQDTNCFEANQIPSRHGHSAQCKQDFRMVALKQIAQDWLN